MAVKPENEAELSAAVAGARGPLRVQGGGTRGVQGAGELLETGGLAGIELYEPGALTLVAGAGTPLAEIKVALEAEGQRLAFEPMDHRGLMGTGGEPTIGGVVAANVSGPRRIQDGACRDHLLGVRFVDGTGQVISNGGRVMKNVTGYDLVKLMAGSWGTLGVLSQVSLKVLPKPETQATLAVEIADAGTAVRALSAALGSPFEVSGAAHAEGQAMVRIDGFDGSVSYRAGRLAEVLAPFGAVREVADGAALWTGIRDVSAFHGVPGDVWRISVKPGDTAAAVAGFGTGRIVLDWGGGLIWALVPEGTDLRARLNVPGHATLVRAAAGTRARIGMFHPEPAPLARIAEGLRARFDPRGIFNPGLMSAPAEA